MPLPPSSPDHEDKLDGENHQSDWKSAIQVEKPDQNVTMESCDQSNHPDPGEPRQDDQTTSAGFFRRFGGAERRIVCSLVVLSTFYGMMETYSVTFFAVEAVARGLNNVQVGLVASVFGLTACVGSPLVAQLIPVLGGSNTLHLGMAVAGTATLATAALALVSSAPLFLAISCLLRGITSLGMATLNNASCVVVANRFPADTSFLLGVINAAMLVGDSIAPAIGGGLYSAGGLALPYLVLGAAALLTVTVSWCCMPTVGGDPQRLSWLRLSNTLVRSFWAWLNVIVTVGIGVAWTGLDQFLELDAHHRLGVESHTLGLYYLLSSSCSGLAGPAVGRLSDLTRNPYPLVAFGLLLAAGGQVAFSPPKWSGITHSRVLLAAGLVARDVGLMIANVPIYKITLEAAVAMGLPDSLSVQSYVSGVVSASYSLGGATGPLLAGALTDAAGFSQAAVVLAGMTAVLGAAAVAAAVHRGCRQLGRPLTRSSQVSPTRGDAAEGPVA